MSTSNFQVGDYIIDSNQVYSVSKIESSRLFYSSLDNNSAVSGSIPIENTAACGFRLLLTPAEIKDFFEQLSTAPVPAVVVSLIDSKFYRDIICQNDPFELIPLLKQLWANKSQPNMIFSGNNKATFEAILTHLSHEFSLVTKKTPEFVRLRIIKALSLKA